MNARLCSLLVAGGAALVAVQPPTLAAPVTLQALSLREEGGRKSVALSVPGFQGVPRLQVLSSPDRVVVDLHGVMKGGGIGRKELETLQSEFVQRARLAQYALSPEPITRLVLEVKPGVQARVASGQDRLEIFLQAGEGSVLASMESGPMAAPEKVLADAPVLVAALANEAVPSVATPSLLLDAPGDALPLPQAVPAAVEAPALSAPRRCECSCCSAPCMATCTTVQSSLRARSSPGLPRALP